MYKILIIDSIGLLFDKIIKIQLGTLIFVLNWDIGASQKHSLGYWEKKPKTCDNPGFQGCEATLRSRHVLLINMMIIMSIPKDVK